MKVDCEHCDVWEESWMEIRFAVQMWYNKIGEFNAAPFKFCPWCGAKLKVEE